LFIIIIIIIIIILQIVDAGHSPTLAHPSFYQA